MCYCAFPIENNYNKEWKWKILFSLLVAVD